MARKEVEIVAQVETVNSILDHLWSHLSEKGVEDGPAFNLLIRAHDGLNKIRDLAGVDAVKHCALHGYVEHKMVAIDEYRCVQCLENMN